MSAKRDGRQSSASNALLGIIFTMAPDEARGHQTGRCSGKCLYVEPPARWN